MLYRHPAHEFKWSPYRRKHVEPYHPAAVHGKNVHDKQTIQFDKADHVIQSIQVCTTDKKKKDDKIKGAEIWAVRVGPDGTLFEANLSDKFRRPNCARWHEKVSCPSNQIAIGVEASWGDGGFAGLRLRCKAVGPKE